MVRLGSTTILLDAVSRGGNRVECNTVEAVKKSADKLLMKTAFSNAQVKTASWYIYNGDLRQFISKARDVENATAETLPYPIVAKHIRGSRGEGNTLIKTAQEMTSWLVGKTSANYIFEKFYSYNREYRLHITKDGCFYTCRKVLKEDTPNEDRWKRNDSNCNWLVEDNTSFDKPSNWTAIVAECVKALNAVGLDVGAFDVKVQSTTDSRGRTRTAPEFIILESNSAPSFGEITLEKYLQEIPKILKAKHG